MTSTQSSLAFPAAGIALDRAAGRFVVAGGADATWPVGPQLNALSVVERSTGVATVLATPPAGGWGIIGQLGVAVNNPLASYGRRSDDLDHSWFENFPNPGGQPMVGSAGFSLTLRVAPNAPAASALILSAGQGSVAFSGIEILVDLGTAVLVMVPPGRSVVLPLPIPGDPALHGVVLTAQGVHAAAGTGLLATRGLRLAVR